MATTKVSALTELTSPDGAEQLLVNDGGTSKRLLISNLPVGSLGANTVDSDQYVDGSIDTIHIDDDQVTYAKIQNVSADERILGRVSGADGVIEELTKAQVLTFANVEDGADVTDATNVAAAGALMDSECAGLAAVKATTGTFLSADETKLDGIEANATADQTAGEILTLLEDGIDSVHYKDGSIDNEHIADDAIDSEHYADGSIDTAHIGDDQVTADKLANSINTDIATGVTAGTTANAALPKAGGTMTGAVVGATDTDTSNSGTVDLDFTDDTNFVLTLTGNITSLTASNEVAGQSGFIVFIQDGTGSRTVSLHGDYETAAGAGLTLTSTASATDIVPYVVAASSRILLGTPQLAFS